MILRIYSYVEWSFVWQQLWTIASIHLALVSTAALSAYVEMRRASFERGSTSEAVQRERLTPRPIQSLLKSKDSPDAFFHSLFRPNVLVEEHLHRRTYNILSNPSPLVFVVALLAYLLTYHHLHTKQRTRFKYHSILLLAGTTFTAAVAATRENEWVDVLLVWIPASLNDSMLVSYILGVFVSIGRGCTQSRAAEVVPYDEKLGVGCRSDTFRIHTEP